MSAAASRLSEVMSQQPQEDMRHLQIVCCVTLISCWKRTGGQRAEEAVSTVNPAVQSAAGQQEVKGRFPGYSRSHTYTESTDTCSTAQIQLDRRPAAAS